MRRRGKMKMMRRTIFEFKPFSKKQRQILNWWMPESPVHDYDGTIADGAIRSGKTVSMSLGFVFWAMEMFDGQNFIMAGKTISSFQRNVLTNLKTMLRSRGYHVYHHLSGETPNMLEVMWKKRTNYFYIFGGKDEGSQQLVQGITAAGAFFDEVALMPESFVSQATARCSVEGAKWWFNCNPAGPMHWFKQGWIYRRKEKRLLYLHFTMDDNLSLSEKVKEKYRNMYAGVFYLRYIKGLWAMAEGLIYTMFSDENLYTDEEKASGFEVCGSKKHLSRLWNHEPMRISGDVGRWTDHMDDSGMRWDSRSEEARRSSSPQKTDAQYADDMAEFMGARPEDQCVIIVDSSAASFIQELRSRGWIVKAAENEVLDGIRSVSTMLARRNLRINRKCKGLILEMQSYVWDDKAAERGEEKPVKQMDHGPDALRYRINALPKWRIGT